MNILAEWTNQIFLPDGECGEDEPCRVGQCRNPDDDLPGCGMEDDAGAVAGEVWWGRQGTDDWILWYLHREDNRLSLKVLPTAHVWKQRH